MTCDQATTMLRRLASSADDDPGAPAAALLDHLADCPACLEEVAVLSTAATGSPSRLLEEIYREHGCALVERLLPEWAQLQRDGGDPAERDPAAWRHHQSCERCRAELVELRALLDTAEQGEFGAVPSLQPWQASASPAELHLEDPAGKLAVNLVLRRSAEGTLDAEVRVGRTDQAPLEPGATVSALDRNQHPLKTALINELGEATLAGLEQQPAYLKVHGAGQLLTLPLGLGGGPDRTGEG
jgi:hypothetical protein